MDTLSEALRKDAVDEMVKDMQEHDFDVKKKPLREHAREVLVDRLKIIAGMNTTFEELIASATIQTYDQPLRDGNRKQMIPILTAYPGMKKKTAKAVIAQLYGE